MEIHTLRGMDLPLYIVGSSRFSVLYESALGRAHLRLSLLGKEAGKIWLSILRYDWRLLPKDKNR